MRTYHIGFCKNGDTLIVQASPSKDGLSCQTWIYFGERINTKKNLYKNRKELLQEVNKSYSTNFRKIKIT